MQQQQQATMANNESTEAGTISYDNGNVFVGAFKPVILHGIGKMVYKDGTIHEGIWLEGTLVYEGQ